MCAYIYMYEIFYIDIFINNIYFLNIYNNIYTYFIYINTCI